MRWTSSSLRPVQLQPMIRMQNLWVFLLERICNPKHYQDLKSLIPQTYWCKGLKTSCQPLVAFVVEFLNFVTRSLGRSKRCADDYWKVVEPAVTNGLTCFATQSPEIKMVTWVGWNQ
ncbi:hypothetical protein HanRHA438_Chr05g0221481 [Helianthus annuus]|nr:hypothetical protein HanRHA438_Chr05g0221481 [Helianthus annuus]